MNKPYYRRRLPHILPPGETVFITFRLSGSLPAEVVQRLKDEREESIKQLKSQNLSSQKIMDAIAHSYKLYFGTFDRLLDGFMKGPRWLEKKEIADIVKRDLHYYDGKDYQLLAYCIMPNHVHMAVVIINSDKPFYAILQSLKRHSAREANKQLNRIGNPFWHEESYDHVVRNSDELNRVMRYVLDNPVKAGLARDWDDWKYSYIRT